MSPCTDPEEWPEVGRVEPESFPTALSRRAEWPALGPAGALLESSTQPASRPGARTDRLGLRPAFVAALAEWLAVLLES